MRVRRSTVGALALSVVAAGPAMLASQMPLTAAVEARSAPGRSVVASLRAGTTVRPGAARGADVLVTIEGWVDASRLGAARDSFPASVAGAASLRVRATPSLDGAILAELHAGAGVHTLEKRGTWTQVRRNAWIPASALGAPQSKASEKAPGARAGQPAKAGEKAPDVRPPPHAAADAPAAAAESAPPGSMSARRVTGLLSAPGGRALGELGAGSVVQPLARDPRNRGWLRVRIEGWVNERDLAPTDTAFSAALSAADLRADPEGTRGRVVRWEVQVLSLQVADPLRRELARDEPYLLARGPGVENALLYLAVPPSLLAEAKAMPPLTTVIVTARVRAGRSEPVGTPILDLLSITRR